MAPKPLTAPARLALLLDWLNGAHDEHVWGPNPLYGQPAPWGVGEGPEDVFTRTDYAAIRRALDAFVRSFDGSAEAAHIVAEPDDDVAAIDDEDIGDLEALLNNLLDQGFGEPTLQNPDICSSALGALRISVVGAGRTKPRLDPQNTTEEGSLRRVGRRAALRAYLAAGAYVLRVGGPTSALVPFLLAHLLTQAGMITVKRCARRGQPLWADCTHLFVDAPGRRGQPKRFCSRSCGLRYAEQSPKRPSSRKRSHK